MFWIKQRRLKIKPTQENRSEIRLENKTCSRTFNRRKKMLLNLAKRKVKSREERVISPTFASYMIHHLIYHRAIVEPSGKLNVAYWRTGKNAKWAGKVDHLGRLSLFSRNFQTVWYESFLFLSRISGFSRKSYAQGKLQ